MLVEKTVGTFEIIPVSKEDYSVTFEDQTVKASRYVHTVQKGSRAGQQYISTNRPLIVSEKKVENIVLTNDQITEMKAERKAFEAEKEQEIIDFMKSIDLNGIEINQVYGYKLVLVRNNEELANAIDALKEYDMSFVCDAFYKYAASRYDQEKSYYKHATSGMMEPSIIFVEKEEKEREEITAEKTGKTSELKALEAEMYDQAPSMTDEEFEDFYDLPRSWYL